MFSADRISDSNNPNAFTETGFRWNYGDSNADEKRGRFMRGADFFANGKDPLLGASRESDTNTPIAMHTYECQSGTCTFFPGVSARNAAGDWETEWATITVHSQSESFPGTQTVCVSSSGQWDGDIPCPADAAHAQAIPGPNEWQSNTRYLLRRGEQFADTCIAYNKSQIVVGAFGDENATKPEIQTFGIGHDGRCSDAIPSNSAVATYSVPRWIEDITLHNLRVGTIDIGMSFENVTLDNLDMDFEDQAAAHGAINLNSADACSKNAGLDCANVPLPQGFYLSGSRVIGSATNPPGLNIKMLSSSCVSFFGLIDNEIRNAFEHNVRLECASRVLGIHNDINGNHLGNRGDKNAFTIRPEGYANIDMIGKNKIDSTLGRGAAYDNRYIVAKNMYFGTPDSINNAARITIAPTKSSDTETTRFGLVSGNYIDMGSAAASKDVDLGGYGLACYNDNAWTEGNLGCNDGGQESIPEGSYSVAKENLEAPVIPDAPEDYQ